MEFATQILIEPDKYKLKLKEDNIELKSKYHEFLSKDYSTSNVTPLEMQYADSLFDLVEILIDLELFDMAQKISAKLQFMFGIRKSKDGWLLVEGMGTQRTSTKMETTTKQAADDKNMFGNKK